MSLRLIVSMDANVLAIASRARVGKQIHSTTKKNTGFLHPLSSKLYTQRLSAIPSGGTSACAIALDINRYEAKTPKAKRPAPSDDHTPSRQTFISDVEKMLERDLATSRQVDLLTYQKKPFWFKLAARVSRLLAPIL